MPCCSCSWPIFCTWNELCWGQLPDFKGNWNDQSSLPVIICFEIHHQPVTLLVTEGLSYFDEKTCGHGWSHMVRHKTWSVLNGWQTRVFFQWKSYVRHSIQPPDLCPPWHICTSNLLPFTSFAETEDGGPFQNSDNWGILRQKTECLARWSLCQHWKLSL